MGCDIHLHVERRAEDGTWQRAEAMVPPRYKFKDSPDLVRERWYDGRNYSLFAMLADVRNGAGFAGVDTGDPVKPIEKPRGLPDDVSAEVRAESDEWDTDGHSHSYFTVAELLAVDWTGEQITHRGWLTAPEFHRYDKFQAAPESYSGSVAGQNVRHVSNDEMRRLIADLEVITPWTKHAYVDKHGDEKPRSALSYCTQLEWITSWSEAAGGEWAQALVRLAHLAAGDLDSVRFVFWFDN